QDHTKYLPSVNIDYEAAALEVTRQLIEGTNAQPAIITGGEHVQSKGLKDEGYKKAMTVEEIQIDDSLDVDTESTYVGGVDAAAEIIQLEKRPKAVSVTTDEMAVGVIHGLQDHGITVPDDIEVSGFNNTRVAMMVRPTLTTVIQPMYDIGAVAMRLLTKYMNHETVDENTVILPHRIMERDSTK